MPQFELQWFPSQIFWVLTCFLFLFVVMKWWIVPRIETGIEKRNKLLSFYVDEAKAMSEKAQKVVKAYEKGLEKAEQDALSEVSAVHVEIEQKMLQEEQKINADFVKKLHDLRKERSKKHKEMKDALETEAIQMADRLVDKIQNPKGE